MSDPTLGLPFDQYQRYRLVADLLEALRPEGRRLTVLDVGGRTALLRLFLPEDTVHLVDVEASEEPGLVLGDGSRLPFADGAVDAVVAFDTLEHVPRGRRDAFLDEVLRVAGSWAIVAGPYDTEGVAHAEELLTEFLHGKMETRHRYLEEHAANGLPSLEDSTRRLERGGARVAAIGHANLQRWLALMCAELYMDRDPQLRALAGRYYEFYNATLYASDHAAPVYRHAVVAAKDGAALPDAEGLLAPPVAPSGVFEPVGALLRQLIEFDVQRGVVKPEWDRLEGVNADLQLDLEGHRETLGLLREEVGEQRKVIEEQRSRLIDLLGDLEDAAAEIEERGEVLERERAEAAAVIEELRRELEAAESERGAQESRAQELERGLSEVQAHEAELEASLHGALGDLAGARAELEAAAEAIADRDRRAVEELDAARRELGAEVDAVREEFLGAQAAARQLEQVLLDERAGAAATREELEGRLAELESARASLVSELDDTHRALGERQSELDLARGELDARRAHGEALERHISELAAAHEGQVHELHLALGEKQAELDRTIARFSAELAAEREELAALRATLRDRRANLRRVFARKPPLQEGPAGP